MHQFDSGTASQATRHGRSLGGIFVSQWPPIYSPLDPRAGGGASASETRAASEVPGIEPGRAVTRTSDMTTVPLRELLGQESTLTHPTDSQDGPSSTVPIGPECTTRAHHMSNHFDSFCCCIGLSLSITENCVNFPQFWDIAQLQHF